MEIFCLPEFKTEFDKLKRKKAYSNLTSEIINYFFDKSTVELSSGRYLNNNNVTPYIKKRLKGSGGYRVYYLLVYKSDSVYLMFVHPKTGPMAAANITDESKALLYKKVLDCINSRDLYKLSVVNKKITFKKV